MASLKIHNISGGDSGLELFRSGKTNWRIINSGGVYRLQADNGTSGTNWAEAFYINESANSYSAAFAGSVAAPSFKGNLDWNYLTSVPSVFPPAEHTHNFNDIIDAENQYLTANTTQRKVLITNTKSAQGYISRIALGLTNPSYQFSPAILSVGKNDAGTEWVDFIFQANGDFVAPNLLASDAFGIRVYFGCQDSSFCHFSGAPAYYFSSHTYINGDLYNYNGNGNIYHYNLQGNANTASALQTARTINGTFFDGSSSITTAAWGNARTLSFTNALTGSVTIDGSNDVSIGLKYPIVSGELSSTGWYKVATLSYAASGEEFVFAITRQYNYVNSESYLVSFSKSYCTGSFKLLHSRQNAMCIQYITAQLEADLSISIWIYYASNQSNSCFFTVFSKTDHSTLALHNFVAETPGGTMLCRLDFSKLYVNNALYGSTLPTDNSYTQVGDVYYVLI